jgi:GNAT superfamily N-acetyltransferase
MIVKYALPEHYRGITSLFERNYEHYHYDALLDYEQLTDLFSRDFIGWVALDGNTVAGFAALYNTAEGSSSIIKLAHLLVDERYRGRHLGSLLEAEREKYYKLTNNSIVLASCVEIPPQSMFLKKKHGFSFLGARVNYRPDFVQRSHSILMGKYNKLVTSKYLEKPSLWTQNLINTCCASLGGERIFIKKETSQIESYGLIVDVKSGRKTATPQKKSIHSLSLAETIKNIKDGDMPYVAVKTNAANDGFLQTDNFLIHNGFWPVIFLPDYDDNFDLLEYQYFKANQKYEYDELIKKLKEIKIYEDRISICAL